MEVFKTVEPDFPKKERLPWTFFSSIFILLVSCFLGPVSVFSVVGIYLAKHGKKSLEKKFSLISVLFIVLIFAVSTFLTIKIKSDEYKYPESSLLTNVFSREPDLLSPFWVINNSFSSKNTNFTFFNFLRLIITVTPLFWFFRFCIEKKTSQLKFRWRDSVWESLALTVAILGLALTAVQSSILNSIGERVSQNIYSELESAAFKNLPTPSPMPNPGYFIKLLPNIFTDEPYSKARDALSECQPDSFDPKIVKLEKILEEKQDNKFVYQLAGQQGVSIKITEILLAPPFKATSYSFGCASQNDYVLEITKDGQRYYLFTHVNSFDFSSNKASLFIINFVKNTKNEWEQKGRIVNLETKEKIELPNTECTSDSGFWDQNKLFTFGGTDHGCPGITKVCIWDENGKPLKQLEGELDQFAGAKCYLTASLGLLPNDNTIFYATVVGDSEKNFTGCSLALQSLGGQSMNKLFVIDSSNPHCPNRIEFDFKNVNFSSSEILYRAEGDIYDEKTNSYPLSDWKIITSE